MAEEQKRPRGRPATGVTPIRHIRIGLPLWDEITALAKQRGETATDLVVRAAEQEVKRMRAENARNARRERAGEPTE